MDFGPEVQARVCFVLCYPYNMNYDGNDFYCDVALQGVADLRKEYESEGVLAFHHTRPTWPLHIVVVPKKHIPSFTAISTEDNAVLGELFHVLKKLAMKVEARHGAARILTNLGSYQDSKHLHFHITSGKEISK